MTTKLKRNVRSTLVGSAALAGAALLAIAAPLAAHAHVSVSPGQAAAGSYASLTFKVPNESATTGAIKLEVDLPQDTPFTSVSYLPVPGWSAEIETSQLPKPVQVHGGTVTEAPTKVTWTADKGTSITAGQFQQFVISVGPVPDTGRVLLAAYQTYSDGQVVAWDEESAAGSTAEPEHPSPVLYINEAPPADDADAGSGVAVTPSAPSDGATDTGAHPSDTAMASDAGEVSLWLAFGGLGLAAVALVVSVFALVNRKTTAKS